MIRNIPIIGSVIGLRIFILTIFSILFLLVVRTGLEPVWDSEPLLPLGVPPSLFQLAYTNSAT